MIQRGHKIHLICHPGTLLEKRAHDAGIHVHPISFRRGNGIVSFVRMLSILRRIRPDILAFNTPRPILLGSLATRISRVPVMIVFRRVNFPLRRNFITRLKYSWGIDCIVAISESISCQLQADGVPLSRIRTVYEGMDLDLYPNREPSRQRLAGERVTVGTVAYLSQEKGLSYLVEAAALIPDVRRRMRFVIVGEGECRRDLENQVSGEGLQDCFEFVGFQNSPTSYFDRFDIFVLPSLSEGLSSAILTAMATRVPVVATHVGGIPELIRHGENGLLVPPADAVSIARAIERLADNPEEAFRMGQAGRLRLEKDFTLERKILETERLCISLLQRKVPVRQAADV
jgi:L-malate glycosyltransferase